MCNSKKVHIFASVIRPVPTSSGAFPPKFLGLTGFDGKTKWYVSTRSWATGGSLISSVGKLIGNNEYALAA